MFKRFLGDRRANVATIFAIAAIPLLSVTGAVVDYTYGFRLRTLAQDALDAATLAGGKKVTSGQTVVSAEVSSFFASNVSGVIDPIPTVSTVVSGATVTSTATLNVPTHILSVVGINNLEFDLRSQVTSGIGTLEVALVLDNSTSMAGSKISTLKTAATNLVTTLYNLGSTSTKTDPIKVGLVPFGASVNVGSQYSTASWLDTSGNGTYNADAMKDSSLLGSGNAAASTTNNFGLLKNLKDSSGNAVTWGGCVEERPAPYDVTDDPPSTATNPTADQKKTLFVPMVAPDEPDNWTCSTSSCAYAGSSSSKYRYNGVPTGSVSYNNYLPDDGDYSTCAADYTTISSITKATPGVIKLSVAPPAAGTVVVFSTTGSLPGGLTAGTPYYVVSPSTSGKSFSVATTSGGSAIKTTSNGSGTHYFNKAVNFTCSNGSANCDGTGVGKSEKTAFGGQTLSTSPLCKYGSSSNKATVASISIGGFPGGPNFMCTTTAVTPLTTTKSTVTTAINAQQANGYTNITAGLMWGWRLLSPGTPFTDGRAYTDTENQKIIVLMTDGANTYLSKSNFLKSLYSAWGYIAENHLGTTSPSEDDVVEKMESRMALACTNAKLAGIKIYTVAFTITDQTTLDLLTNCASDPSMAYQSSDNAALLSAFNAIGDSISQLRIAE
jgi:Flp pilus assembly protein TadG